MDISVETFLKPDPGATSESVGLTRLSVEESAYVELMELEENLKDSNNRETMVSAETHAIEVSTPQKIGELKEPQVRVYLDSQSGLGHFHLVAKRASDNALVYTEPTMIRLVAV